MLAPVGARPLAAALGAPLLLRGVSGRLARDNATRNPRRTASTATALMIGLALVVAMGVLASSLKASFGPLLDDATDADLYVTAASAQSEGFSPDVGRIVASVPGVAAASATGWGEARFDGADAAYSSVDPATVEQVVDLQLTSGSATTLGTDGVLVPADLAAEHGWSVGDTVSAEFPSTGATVAAGARALRGRRLRRRLPHQRGHPRGERPDRLQSKVLVTLADGADATQTRRDVASALRGSPDAKVLTPAQFAEESGGMVDQLLTLMTALLLLAVVIALLGIVNTLALSVHERTRELGLLRAVGMTTAQVRAMVRWESVVISGLGGVAGAVLGLGLGVVLTRSMDGQGITVVDVPYLQVGGALLLALAAGVLAAVGPARSASRVDVLRAVVTD